MSALTLASCEKEPGNKIDVSSGNLTFTAKGAVAQTVTVKAGDLEWEAVLNDASTTWLHLEKTGNEVTVTVDDNPDVTERTSKFTVRSKAGGASREITVTQEAASIAIGVTVSFDMEFDSFGGTKFVAVAAGGRQWEAEVTEGDDWITIEESAEGISVTVTPIQTDEARRGEMTVSAATGDVTVAIAQRGLTLVADTFVGATSLYFGDKYETGFATYIMVLYSNDFNPIEGYSGDGSVFELSLYCGEPLPLNDKIPSGTYNFAQFDQNNTTDFKVDSDGLYMWDERFGGIGEYDIVSGTVKVEDDGDDHKISIEFITTDGKIFRGSYEGYMPEENAIVISSIREDVDFGTISGDGELAFCGDVNYDGATYYWVATMCGGGVYIEDGSVKGTGVCLTLEGFSDQSRRDAMPAGTYFLDQKIASAGDIVPFMLWPGELSLGSPWYCWYLVYEDGKIVDYSALVKGDITVSHNGNTGSSGIRSMTRATRSRAFMRLCSTIRTGPERRRGKTQP